MCVGAIRGRVLAEVCDSLAFFDANYDEALTLAEEARDYLARHQGTDRSAVEPLDRMAVSCAALKVTSRLTQVMAWLLVQKAVQAGEMSRSEAAGEAYRLSGQDVCLSPRPLEERALPAPFADIYERSRKLYERVARLDSMMERGIG